MSLTICELFYAYVLQVDELIVIYLQRLNGHCLIRQAACMELNVSLEE
jgi:hypothetical protein